MRQHEIIQHMIRTGDLIRCLPMATARCAEYADLAGEDQRSCYDTARAALAALEAEIRNSRSELGGIAAHTHVFNDNDYCNICGADGRA